MKLPKNSFVGIWSQKKLRSEISKRWPKIGYDIPARAQLEYILEQAGLLVKPLKD